MEFDEYEQEASRPTKSGIEVCQSCGELITYKPSSFRRMYCRDGSPKLFLACPHCGQTVLQLSYKQPSYKFGYTHPFPDDKDTFYMFFGLYSREEFALLSPIKQKYIQWCIKHRFVDKDDWLHKDDNYYLTLFIYSLL